MDAAGAVRGHLLRDLVALEHVLERRDLEAHLLGEADHHQDFVRAVAVDVHEPLAVEDLDERVELQIAPRLQDVLARAPSPCRSPARPSGTPSRA